MAVRKQDFDDHEEQSGKRTKRPRITIDVSSELRRRIKIAASQNDLPISEYVGKILDQAVPRETRITQRQRRPLNRKTLEHALQVRQEIMEHTNGRVFDDSTEIIRQMREERSRELEQL